MFIPFISEPSITSTARPAACRAASTSSSMNVVIPFTKRMFHPAVDVPRTPFLGDRIRGRLPGSGEARRGIEQPLGGVGASGEHDVLTELAQFGVDLVVHGELAGVDDAEAHAGLDRAQQEHRVHRFAHRLVAAERERQVRHAARDVDVRQLVGDQLRRLDEVEAVPVVLLHPGGDGEDVRVDDDVVGREADLVDEQMVGPPGDVDLAIDGVGLADLVEGHDDDGGAVVEADAGLFEELVDTFLHRDRVDDRLALHALQSCLDHAELRRVDHHRHAGDLGLTGDQVEERGHRLDAVDEPVVHVDVDDLCAVLHLIPSDRRVHRRSRCP